jgi:hypothetical protein
MLSGRFAVCHTGILLVEIGNYFFYENSICVFSRKICSFEANKGSKIRESLILAINFYVAICAKKYPPTLLGSKQHLVSGKHNCTSSFITLWKNFENLFKLQPIPDSRFPFQIILELL